MTFREKLKQEYPESVIVEVNGGCLGCPATYEYEEGYCGGECDGRDISDKICRACWDREMPEEEGKADCHGADAPRNDSGEVDMVNRPPHYTHGGIECIDAIEAALSAHSDAMSAWLTGQVLKYCWRWPLKNGAEDLKKARFYLGRLIAREEKKHADK